MSSTRESVLELRSLRGLSYVYFKHLHTKDKKVLVNSACGDPQFHPICLGVEVEEARLHTEGFQLFFWGGVRLA